MEHAAPRVSIALPVYNGERTLEQTLRSVEAQTDRSFELLIFDNASTDRTGDIARTFAAEHSFARYHRNDENIGAARNYNRALQAARGRYFKWLASDDVLDPDYVQVCADWLDRAPQDVVLVFPRRRFIDPEGQFVADCPFVPLRRVEHDGGVVYELSYRELVRYPHGRGRLLNIAPAVVFGMVRREAALRTRGIASFLGSDLTFNAEMALLGRLWQVPEILWSNRIHAPDSWRARMDAREQAEWFDPAAPRGARHLHLTLLAEYLRSIALLERRPWSAAARLSDLLGTVQWMSMRSIRRWKGRLGMRARAAQRMLRGDS